MKSYPSCHELVCHDSKCEVVHSVGMIHFANNLWSHISWGSARILGVIWFDFPGYS